MLTELQYTVVERNGWSYVVGAPELRDAGPWRYRWEAQEYADELNGAAQARQQTKRRDYRRGSLSFGADD